MLFISFCASSYYHSTFILFASNISQIKLSHEHQGFMFQPDATKSVDMLVEHSGGKVSKALQMAIENDEIKSIESKDTAVADSGNDQREMTEDSTKIVGNPMEREAKNEVPVRGKKCFNCFC